VPSIFTKAIQIFQKASSKDDAYLYHSIINIIGFKPKNIQLYRLAISHNSIAQEIEGVKYSNERLEYLGDAVLGAIVAELLFKKYPLKDEGFLTEMRSRIVNRESLNELGKSIGLNNLIDSINIKKNKGGHKSIYGDALEALVGAVFLDAGFVKTKKFVNNTLMPHYDLDSIVSAHKNFKSLLIEYAQREGKKVSFDIVAEKERNNTKYFVAEAKLDGTELSQGQGYTKKKAEQAAAEKACEMLKLIVSNEL
jgi:ribonuclease-3